MYINIYSKEVEKIAKNLLKNSVISKLTLTDRNKRQIAFTLAEVLIVLLIIGTLASLVIPGIINDTKENEYNVGVKNANSTLSQALDMIIAQNNGEIHVGTGDNYAVRDDFCSVLKCLKQDTTLNIFGNDGNPNSLYKEYKSNTYLGPWGNGPNNPAAILNNGYFMQFSAENGCTTYGVNACGQVWVDINGNKGPNMVGKDFHLFYIVKIDGEYLIRPSGSPGSIWTCSIGPSYGTAGWGCTYVRLTNPNAMP